jgi:hypothetical protein
MVKDLFLFDGKITLGSEVDKSLSGINLKAIIKISSSLKN